MTCHPRLSRLSAAANRPSGAADNVSCFNHPLTDGNPNAFMTVTSNRGRQTAIRPLVPTTASMYYDDNGTGLSGGRGNNVWCISRDDSLQMPYGAGFTVHILRP